MSAFLSYVDRNHERILRLGLEHLEVVLVALALGTGRARSRSSTP